MLYDELFISLSRANDSWTGFVMKGNRLANHIGSSPFYRHEIITDFIPELCNECCFCRSFFNSE
jgi:hypothetical protein